MGRYRGPAVLITSSGAEIPVGADLASDDGTPPEWGGLVTIEGKRWTVVANADTGIIRLPDGSESPFVRPSPEPAHGAPDAPFRIRILGNGVIPF